ncbi:SPW repeat protein [Streptacidiphilus sp. ASG 303]|uniref:SPW repeat protein n=1 Tax=Streptacidiphilus sp. ASG 303 TaxID=2896847 RepID=UPI001E4230B0|nr:SPW repeat protein [Streptacidiphilus sp. ASG 303]MCD0481139.1 SPW repeat protein [Streptacidiphilus sp. ASG 303]
MEHHPDIMEMRARYEQAASTPRAQGIEALGLVTGLYLALSPWITGFNGLTTLTVCNLVAGIAYALLMCGFGPAFERTHGMAWGAALIGVWTIISPWVVSGNVDTTKTIVNNVVTGAVALLLALASGVLAGGRRGSGRAGSMRHRPAHPETRV